VLPELVAAVEDGADLAIGSRYVPGGSIPDWKWLRRAIQLGNENRLWFARDKNWESLRNDPEHQAILNSIQVPTASEHVG